MLDLSSLLAVLNMSLAKIMFLCGYSLIAGYSAHYFGSKVVRKEAISASLIFAVGLISSYVIVGIVENISFGFILQQRQTLLFAAVVIIVTTAVFLMLKKFQNFKVNFFVLGISYGLIASVCTSSFASFIDFAKSANVIDSLSVLGTFIFGIIISILIIGILVSEAKWRLVWKLGSLPTNKIGSVTLILVSIYLLYYYYSTINNHSLLIS